MKRPNIVFVFADQLRPQALGYAGNPVVESPRIDALSTESVAFTNAVACAPVCTPFRACLLTGRYPLSHGLFLNDVRLPVEEVTLAEVLREAGYDTAYIGKWHLDGPERAGFTPPGPRRQGFDYWAVGNCTHDYMHSLYYRDTPEPLYWEGYDAHAQAREACEYIRAHGDERPYCLFLSWGPPHNPYQAVPQEYLDRYDPAEIPLRPNVTAPNRQALAGYYAHVSALDDALGWILDALEETGQAEDTIVVFTSDHGDMLGSHGVWRKQWPWDESVCIPLLVRYPAGRDDADSHQRQVHVPFSVVDLMPTLLSLCGAPIPDAVEGTDLAHLIRGGNGPAPASALIMSVAPFGEQPEGPEWRGVRTDRYTYAETLDGPWLLYDNLRDPYQLENRVGQADVASLQEALAEELRGWLARTDDPFVAAEEHRRRWGYVVNERNEIPYTW
jgi:arylsulfatase A-like enzyme